MPATLNSIIDSALAEWNHWGNSVWNVAQQTKKIVHKDDDPEYAQYIISHYCAVAGGSPSLVEIQNDDYAWSAVGMSAIMKNAGFTSKEFRFSQSHSRFIRDFVQARFSADKKAAFWAYRQGETGGAPAVGDLVGYARPEKNQKMTHEKAQTYFDRTSSYLSHTDVVVAKRAGEIDVIGANVLDSVTRKTLTVDASGHISDKAHYWFVTLKRREV